MRTIELTDEIVDGIVTQTLRQDLQLELSAIERLEKKKKLEAYEEVDLADSLKTASAMRRVLKYYGIDT